MTPEIALLLIKGTVDTALLAGIFMRLGGFTVRLKILEDWVFKQQEKNTNEKNYARQTF